MPPMLAGREREQAVLAGGLADIAVGESPPHDIVLTGPRGNGKTALLKWFEGSCGAIERPVDVMLLTPQDVPDLARLAAELAPARGLERLLPRKASLAGVASAEWSGAGASENLAGRLIARCRKRPLAVLLDEAHTLDAAVGKALLNASQRTRGEAPFLLALAGAPGLLGHLATMDASFWDRLGHGLLGIGLLNERAAKEALEKPLAANGVRMASDALDAVVAHAQGYAYFIQLWGETLWNLSRERQLDALTLADVDAGLPEASAQMVSYYERRVRELEAEGLLPAAAAVAPLFDGDSPGAPTDADVDAALGAAGLAAADRLGARDGLNRLGYLWCPPKQRLPITWSPGIPSLMRHVVERMAR